MNAKYRDAEKEVNMLQIKIQEVNGNLSKHRKDLECKCCLSFKEVEYKHLVFEGNQCLSSACLLLQWFTGCACLVVMPIDYYYAYQHDNMK